MIRCIKIARSVFYLRSKILLVCMSSFISAHEQIHEGFVTFATQNYFQLLEVMIDSVHYFSTRPIVAFGINADIPFDKDQYPRLIAKRIDVDLSHVNIFSLKPRIILESGIDYGIYIEADDIANAPIDQLFDYVHTITNFPLCPIHPHDPDNQQNIMELLNVSYKSMPYVHGHLLFAPYCKSFIREWYFTCLNFINQAANYDETILNVLLWKYGATRNLPMYDAYFESLNECVEKKFHNSFLYCMFHGCKDSQMAGQMLYALKKVHEQK